MGDLHIGEVEQVPSYRAMERALETLPVPGRETPFVEDGNSDRESLFECRLERLLERPVRLPDVRT